MVLIRCGYGLHVAAIMSFSTGQKKRHDFVGSRLYCLSLHEDY